MPEQEIPLTCPECGAGLTEAECFKCGYRLPAEPIDDPPTDEHHVAASVPATAIRSGANRKPSDGYPGLVVLALFEWTAGAVALLAGLRWLRLIPQVHGEPDGMSLWLGKVALVPGGGFTVTAAAALFIAVGAFLLMRKRWAWVASFILCLGWVVAAFALGGAEVSLVTVGLMVPAVVGFFLLILGWAAPR